MDPSPPNLVKFESRTIDLRQPQKGSFLGKFMMALGAMTAPAAFFPPVGSIVAAGGMGIGILGSHADRKAYMIQSQQGAAPQYYGEVTPGLNAPRGRGFTPVAAPNDPALSIISARTGATNQIPQAIGGNR